MKTMQITDKITLTARDFNLEKSIEVYNKCKHLIKKGACYHNVFHVCSEYAGKMNHLGWRIAYGYFSTFENILIRHCYLLDKEGKVIDPTFIKLYGSAPDDTPNYWTIETFSFDDYLKKLSKYDGDASLRKHFIKRQQTIIKWGMQQQPAYAFLDDNF